MLPKPTVRVALAFILTWGCSLPVAPPPPTQADLSGSAEPSGEATALAPTATEIVPCVSPGRIEVAAYPGVVLDEPIAFRIYLPPCYDPRAGPYPTLYALHGKPFDDSHWDELGLDEAAERAISDGALPPFLIVMPYVPEPLFSHTDGGPGSYEQEFLEGLLATIEAAYAADPRPESRALAGISRGGVWALEIGLLHPEAFGGLAALSPALSVNRPRPEYDPLTIAAGPGPFPGRIFLAAGETDWARAGTEDLARRLEEVGFSSDLLIVPGGHDASVWQASLGPLLQALAGGWAAPG